jgi:hypothetical protein
MGAPLGSLSTSVVLSLWPCDTGRVREPHGAARGRSGRCGYVEWPGRSVHGYRRTVQRRGQHHRIVSSYQYHGTSWKPISEWVGRFYTGVPSTSVSVQPSQSVIDPHNISVVKGDYRLLILSTTN